MSFKIKAGFNGICGLVSTNSVKFRFVGHEQVGFERQDKSEFFIRGGLFVYFLAKQKV